MTARLAAVFLLAAALFFVSPARAQTSPEADALYEQAGVLIKAGRFAEACPKLETSQRLDPGIGTMIRLGYCYEQVGRTASAWSTYLDAEGRARRENDKRADDAASRAKALEPKLSRLVIALKSPAPGQEVHRDGKALDAGLWGVAAPIDPGEHTIEASAPGRRTWTSKITIRGTGVQTVEVPPLAEGRSPAADEAAAEALFQDGKRLVTEKNFAEACPKFEESSRLSPSAGALLSLGDCLEQSDKLASAWGAFVQAGLVARAKADTGREAEADRRAALLAPRLAKLAIMVPPTARVPGFEVHGDGSAVGEGQWGSYLPANVGPHTIEASAPGYRPWSMTIRIDSDGSTASVKIPQLDKIEAMDKPKPSGVQKTAGIVVLSAGAAGLTMGAVAGGIATAEHANLIGVCPTARCPPSLQSNVNSYHTAAAVSTGTFIVGGILGAAGIVVVVTAPKAQAATVSPIVGLGFVGARGRF